jgi:nitrous oxidase accessory protein NosD
VRLQHIFLPLAWAAAAAASSQPPPQRLQAGAVIARGVRVEPGRYALASPDASHPAIVIRGSNLDLDLAGVTLAGAPPDVDPDRFTGLGILVDGGENVTIRNVTVRGYKIGLLARHTTRLRIVSSDFSYNWKARLYSGVEHESLVDWMSYHHNENDEWLASGAGIYVADSTDAQIEGSAIVQGQNGLMLVRSDGARIWNNTFSYLSGVGIGLYRANRNTIMHNKVDWCVRGYSDGFYNRGQDSAGILVYEQSSRNVVAYNSVTHGGDGLFLWAGQSTMDTGQGGANDNVVYANDFSYAPANGIEATFSRNTFYGNRIDECWHGVWGGYSFDSWIANNRFARNVEGIAIEHGQDNRITDNTFDRDETGIHLWKNATQDPAWEYPKRRDTRSRDYDVSGNAFIGSKTALKIHETQNVRLVNNTFRDVETVAALTGDTRNLGIGDEIKVPLRPRQTIDVTLPQPLPGGLDARLPENSPLRNRRSIIVDEWGPYDWKSPKLWPDGRSDASPLRLRVLGPAGDWTVAAVVGATVEPSSGRVPGTITVTPAPRALDVDVRLTYRGERITTPRGEVIPAGAPYVFGYSRFFMPIDWHVQWFALDPSSSPEKDPDAFARAIKGPPVKTERLDRLDLISGRELTPGVPRDYVGAVATADVTLPPGAYSLRTISDDGIRVWVDDMLAIDRWTVHESVVDAVPLGGGPHRLRVEYFEATGFAEWRVEVVKR